MTKPTLLQALLNRPSQSYAFPQEKQPHSDEQKVPRISTDAPGQSIATPGVSSASIDKAYNSSRQKKQASSIDTSSRPSMDFQGPKTHVSSSSHASQSSSVVSTATSYISTSVPPSPPPPPTKAHISELVPKSHKSRNDISSNPDSAPQRRTGAANTKHLNPGGLVHNYSYEEDEEADDESTQDIFYTPNSSPRASLASEISIPMSYATAATTTTPRKTSRRSLRGGTLAQEHSLPYPAINEAPEDDKNLGGTQRQTDALPSLSKKNTKASPSSNPTSKGPSVGITSTEPIPSRTPAPTLPSPPSTRIAVPSTRTPSRSNSLNRGRPTADPRSGPTQGSAGPIGRAQGQSATSQGRAKATVSVASSGSSMSSNSLDGHSLVFSDLTSEATRATTLSPDGNDSGNGLKKEYGSAGVDATKRWVDKAASDAVKATTTPMAPSTTTISSPQKRRPNKSHTYSGLGVGSASVGTGTSTSTPAPANPNHYQQYQYQSRNRDNKAPSVMMSMTAVLEAAEEDELYRNGTKKAGVGSPAWKTRQLLKQHMNGSGKSTVVNTGPNAGAGPPAGVNGASKGKGKERAGTDNYMGSGGGLNGKAGARASSVEKGKGRERDHYPTPYTRHQPITSSPLAPPKPLPALGHPPPRNNSFLQVPLLSRPKLAHRRSRSLGAESMPMYQRSDSPTPSRSPGTSSHLDSDLSRNHKHTRAHSISRSHGASSSTSANTETVDLTALPRSSGELPSKGTTGYTSLVLPRAPPPLNLDSNTARNGYGYGKSLIGGGSGKVDLTKDGLAQTTMASVEVVRGLGGIVGRTGLKGMFNFPLVRRKTIPVKFGLGAGAGEDSGHGVDGGPGGAGETTVLGFTSYRRPPEYVSSGGVLVQVWAVGVDGIDGKLVGVRMAHGGGGGGDSVNGVPPSPASTSSTDPDPEAAGGLPKPDGHGARPAGADQRVADRMQDLDGELEKPKMKGMGLGRSLSLRERLSRSVSLGRSAGKEQLNRQRSPEKARQAATLKTSSAPQSPEKQNKNTASGNTTRTVPGVGYIPGRSFVGRVVECGWEVRDEIVRKGDWVIGLLDIKRCGALTEFIVVDRHRIHRIPHPRMPDPATGALSPITFSLSTASPSTPAQHSLTLEELALIPLCGIPAYRAVRTLMYAFTSTRDNPSMSSVGGTSDITKHRLVGTDATSNFAAYNTMVSRLNLGDHENGRRRRALVLRGHDGIGAVAVQMLVLRGWRVCVHVPFIASPPNVPTTPAVADGFMEEVEERIRKWGAEEVIFDDGEVVGSDEGRGAVVRVIDGLREDGDVFDAVLDTVGGKDVRVAAEKLLRSPGRRVDPDESGNGGGKNGKGLAKGLGQFTTVVGDSPERVIPSAGDLFRAGLRSLKFGGGGGGGSTILSTERGSSENMNVRSHEEKGGKVGYAWVNISQDVDWEGKGVGETIGSVMELALEYGIKPWVGTEYAIANGTGPTNSRPGTPSLTATPTPTAAGVEATSSRLDPGHWEGKRITPFEKAPDIFVSGGTLTSGGTVVVKIAT